MVDFLLFHQKRHSCKENGITIRLTEHAVKDYLNVEVVTLG